MKSKKKTKKGYSKLEEVKPIATPKVEIKMIIRKEVQAQIDIDKDIRRLLATNYYNHNQIASMIRGANLQRVKDVSRKIKT